MDRDPRGRFRWPGRPLATFRRGPGAELRAYLAEHRGRPYVRLEGWVRGYDGQPRAIAGKAVSIHLAELRELVALLDRLDALRGTGSPVSEPATAQDGSGAADGDRDGRPHGPAVMRPLGRSRGPGDDRLRDVERRRQRPRDWRSMMAPVIEGDRRPGSAG